MTEVTATPTYGAPVKATWIVLAVAWVCFIAPIPGARMFSEPNGAENTVSMVLHNLPMLPLLKPAIA